MTFSAGRKWKLVVLESPYGVGTEAVIERNREFARACLRDCLARNESPIASHLLLTQSGVLDDADMHQRVMGIDAGNAWIAIADAVVVYEDFGISAGMRRGIVMAEAHRTEIIYRSLHGNNRRNIRDPAGSPQDQG